jgi:hypothetical protein
METSPLLVGYQYDLSTECESEIARPASIAWLEGPTRKHPVGGDTETEIGVMATISIEVR